ncbi:MAG: hypothetical protein VB046_13960, partial [Paludibacter sp.]|nr:hypothetical protein [Paludibacter sp.]
MKKIIFILILPFAFFHFVYGQVETKFYPDKDALQQNRYIRNHKKSTKVKKMLSFDVQKMMDEDRQNENLDIPFRFGKGFDVNITLSDGEWTTVENGRLWLMEFQSEGAYSINFVFENLYLPDSAELYIVNSEGTMLYGPVTSKQNTKNGFFLTDLIQGDKATIYLYEPTNKKEQSQLIVKRVVHAYKNLFSTMAYGNLGGSEACNNDVVCFPTWDLESDAVALILLSNGDELCSGSLLMTANQNFRSYFLSAFHCVDTYADGTLSAEEITNAENWMFKFQYKMISCGGNTETTSITYNGANFRAAWNTTDFALMELNNSPVGDERFSWLGWDRSGNTPTSGTGIHHPSGDVMKISFDNDALTETFNGSTIGGTSHWFVGVDNGTLEHGSSGSPLFNESKRVIGQLHSGYPGCSSSKQFWYGCFYRSWTGGGTNTTRLSNWLDPTGIGVMTTNTSRTPFISGPSLICTTGTYTINNFPEGATVNWRTSLQLSIISGQGTSEIVVSKISSIFTASVYADITINGNTFTVTKSGIQMGTKAPSIVVYNAGGSAMVDPPYYTGVNYRITAHGSGLASKPSSYFAWEVEISP